jgi:hypothetical protein
MDADRAIQALDEYKRSGKYPPVPFRDEHFRYDVWRHTFTEYPEVWEFIAIREQDSLAFFAKERLDIGQPIYASDAIVKLTALLCCSEIQNYDPDSTQWADLKVRFKKMQLNTTKIWLETFAGMNFFTVALLEASKMMPAVKIHLDDYFGVVPRMQRIFNLPRLLPKE